MPIVISINSNFTNLCPRRRPRRSQKWSMLTHLCHIWCAIYGYERYSGIDRFNENTLCLTCRHRMPFVCAIVVSSSCADGKTGLSIFVSLVWEDWRCGGSLCNPGILYSPSHSFRHHLNAWLWKTTELFVVICFLLPTSENSEGVTLLCVRGTPIPQYCHSVSCGIQLTYHLNCLSLERMPPHWAGQRFIETKPS